MNDDSDNDENLIIPPKTMDISNMQSDDGGPFSLKKVEMVGSHAGACSAFKSSLLTLTPMLLLILHRIT